MTVPIIASSFSGLAEFLLLVAVGLFGCAVASLWFARRGHWLALCFAAPGLIVGTLLLQSMIGSGGIADWFVAVLFIPPLLSAVATALWFWRRKANIRRDARAQEA